MQRIDIAALNGTIRILGTMRAARRLVGTAKGKACMSLLVVGGITALIGKLEPWVMP